MQCRGTKTVVEVTGSAPLVNTQDASLGHAFNSDQISYLPFEGREAASILSLQPGVVYTGNSSHISAASDSRSGAVNGARSDQTNVTLDGVDNNDQTQGLAFTGALRATLDSLQEFRVTTRTRPRSAGRSSGGQVSLVTKSGTNNLHGQPTEYYRPPFGAANDWFNKSAELVSRTSERACVLAAQHFRSNVRRTHSEESPVLFLWPTRVSEPEKSLQVTRVVPSTQLRNGFLTYPCTNDPTCPASGTFTL